MKKLIYIISLLVSVSVFAQTKGSLLIKNATVLTVTNGTLENTDVLVENGKITKIGQNIAAPANTKTIDATGKYVMPGIIDAHSHIALESVNEATDPVTAMVSMEDVIDPLDVSIYRALAGGVTASHAMHGSANVIGGQCETIKHHYGTSNPNALKMEGAPRTIKFALGENPTRVHGRGNGIWPRSRMGVEYVIRNAFSEAREYMKEWEDYNKLVANKRTRDMAVAPEYDLRMEVLADILKGEIIIHCHSYRADEILMLMNVCKDFGVNRLVFQHVNEGYKVAPELAEFGAGASVFSDWWAYKFEVYYSTAYNATILSRNGVVTSINSDSGELIRHLYHEAAKTQRYGGLSDEEALSLITINPAKQLGIDNRVGSIEEGKDGDIVIFENHPLSIYARPLYTIVDGNVAFDSENDAADQRIIVDPEEEYDIPTMETWEDNCMQDTEYMFTSTEK